MGKFSIFLQILSKNIFKPKNIMNLAKERAEVQDDAKHKVHEYEYDFNSNDDLFGKFRSKVLNFSVEDYKKNLSINSKAADFLKKAIENQQVHSMLGIQDIPQIGSKALINIHNFIRDEKSIITQKTLDF